MSINPGRLSKHDSSGDAQSAGLIRKDRSNHWKSIDESTLYELLCEGDEWD